jgi:prolyl-tRNA synthetase
MVVVRGDDEINEIRLARALKVDEVFLANQADVLRLTGAPLGSVGPVGYDGRIVVDRAAATTRGGVAGANVADYHWGGVEFERDYRADVADVRLGRSGDGCPQCDEGVLALYKGIEGGHIFILGSHYSEAMGAHYVDESQQKKPLIMGCYGIGISRLMASAIEQHHDADGMRWPASIAPYQVHLCTIGKEEAIAQAAEALYTKLTESGVEVLWDDRDERPGVKFKDADLIGLPLRITLGGKNFANGHLEAKPRTETDPKKAELIPIPDAITRITSLIAV